MASRSPGERNPMNVRRMKMARRESPVSRRGWAMIAAIVLLALAAELSLISTNWIRLSEGDLVQEMRHSQAVWLRRAAASRAAAQWGRQADYRGETWQPEAALFQGQAAQVQIVVAVPSATTDPGNRQLSITADFPRELPLRHRSFVTLSFNANQSSAPSLPGSSRPATPASNPSPSPASSKSSSP